MKPGRVCSKCPNLQPCAAHPVKPFATAVRSSNLYGSSRWKRERAAFLKQHPTCVVEVDAYADYPVYCGAEAKVVDHTIQHCGDVTAFWDKSNWRALCSPCHQRKTGRETRARVGAR